GEMIINLTPHAINVFSPEGEEIAAIPSSGLARARALPELDGTVDIAGASVPVYRVSYGEVSGLPEPEDDTQYVVSPLAAQAAARAGRTTHDLLMTHDPVRD